METLSHTRESASSFIRQTASQLRASSHQMSKDISQWATAIWAIVISTAEWAGYVMRSKVMKWCLSLANHLERAQADAIRRAAWRNRQGSYVGVIIPAPTLARSSEYAHPRVPFMSNAGAPSSLSDELRYDDFDDAPTAVYHPVPSQEEDSNAGTPAAALSHPAFSQPAFMHHAAFRQGVTQGEVQITSK